MIMTTNQMKEWRMFSLLRNRKKLIMHIFGNLTDSMVKQKKVELHPVSFSCFLIIIIVIIRGMEKLDNQAYMMSKHKNI